MNTILYAMGIAAIIVLIYGIYKLATRNRHETFLVKPGTASSNNVQFARGLLTVIISLAVLAGLFFAWQYFTHL